MDVTVVIPSRNRPELLRKALDSVLEQTHPSVEIIVVNDGSDGDFETAYARLAQELSSRVRFLNLEHTLRGHGQSYAINRGVEAAKGDYVTFLDDDDYWTDTHHLARACKALSEKNGDIYYSSQQAFRGDTPVDGPVWLEGLDKIIEKHGRADTSGIYKASIADLMACSGFAHLNTSIVRRSIYLGMGGMDENIRYECDWDFFLRSIDEATTILFFPGITSRHNAPDPTKTVNMSTAVNNLQKMLFRSYVLDKAVLFAKSPEIVRKARIHKSYTLKRITEQLHKDGKIGQAAFYAKGVHTGLLDIKWYLYRFYLTLRDLAL